MSLPPTSTSSLAPAKQASANPVAFVTGASRGLGRAIALGLAEAGYAIVGTYLAEEENAQAVREEICAKGGDCYVLQCDVSDEASVKEAVEASQKAFGRIDAVIANAGVNRDGMSWKLSGDDWQQVIQTNLTGTFYTLKHTLPMMREARHGRFIAMSSIVAVKGVVGTAAYAASKAGILGLVRAAATENARRNVTVNALLIGYMDEGMFHTMPKELQDAAVRMVPLARPGQTSELVGTIRYLCSDGAGSVTGQAISVTGGLQ